MEDSQPVVVDEVIVLSKFDGDPKPENEVERMHIRNGRIVAVHKIENGEIVATEAAEGV